MIMRGKYAAAAAVLAGTCEGAFAASPALDKADVAWMLVATILVLFMTIPGIALFYGGMAVKRTFSQFWRSHPSSAAPCR